MTDENKEIEKQKENEEKLQKEREQVNETYKERGFQQIDYKEYMKQRELAEKKQKRQPKLPPALRIIIMTPFLLIFCFGLFFIPYMIYLIVTAPKNPVP